jgi:hypothetical protein
VKIFSRLHVPFETRPEELSEDSPVLSIAGLADKTGRWIAIGVVAFIEAQRATPAPRGRPVRSVDPAKTRRTGRFVAVSQEAPQKTPATA